MFTLIPKCNFIIMFNAIRILFIKLFTFILINDSFSNFYFSRFLNCFNNNHKLEDPFLSAKLIYINMKNSSLFTFINHLLEILINVSFLSLFKKLMFVFILISYLVNNSFMG